VATAPTRDGPERATGYLVFAQRASPDADVDVDAWDAQAARFFRTRIGLSEAPRVDAAGVELRLVISPDDGAPGVRAAFGRRREPQDLAAAEAAERLAGGGGLALLARRCETVWLVVRETDPDPTALLLAAVLASALLGPILDVRALDLFGVKTARKKLSG
jgi:hypothetical protein